MTYELLADESVKHLPLSKRLRQALWMADAYGYVKTVDDFDKPIMIQRQKFGYVIVLGKRESSAKA